MIPMADYDSASMFVFPYEGGAGLSTGQIEKGSLAVMHFLNESDRSDAHDLLDGAAIIWDSIMFHMCLVPSAEGEDYKSYLVHLLVEATSNEFTGPNLYTVSVLKQYKIKS